MKLKGEPSTESLRIRLDAEVSAPQQARRAVETLGDQLGPQTIADLRVILSELVGISLSCRSDAPIEFRLELQDGHVRGEVFRVDGLGDGLSGSGHALRILGALVEEWGIAVDRAAAWFRCSAGDPSRS